MNKLLIGLLMAVLMFTATSLVITGCAQKEITSTTTTTTTTTTTDTTSTTTTTTATTTTTDTTTTTTTTDTTTTTTTTTTIALSIDTVSLPDGTVGEAYSTTVVASGGNGTYNWTLIGLPAGLTSDTSGNIATISGTPTSNNVYSIQIIVTDTVTVVIKNLTLVVN